jgi:hypothetical protein
MPKYNLMDNLDSEESNSPRPSEDKDKKISENEVDDTKLSDYIVEDIVISEPEMEKIEYKPESDQEVSESGADQPGDFTDHERYTVPEGTPPMQPFDLG